MHRVSGGIAWDSLKVFVGIFVTKHTNFSLSLLSMNFQISRGYNETVTIFYIHIIADAISKSDHNEQNFEDFISHNQHIEAKDLLFKYYSPGVIQNKESTIRLAIFDEILKCLQIKYLK